MSVLEKLKIVLGGGDYTPIVFRGIHLGLGKYTDDNLSVIRGKIVFASTKDTPYYNSPKPVMGGEVIAVEVFKVVMRCTDYAILERDLNFAKEALIKAGYVQISGFEHIEPKEGETALQLAVSFKSLK